MSDWRFDPITREPVVISEGRLARPVDYPQPLGLPGTEACPFCVGHESATPAEVLARRSPGGSANGPGWRVRVIPNKFPTFDPGRNPVRPPDTARPWPAVGIHEVVIQSPSHTPGLPFLGVKANLEVLEVYRDRVRTFERDPQLRSIVLAENWGMESGGSLTHPHGQLLATAEETPTLARWGRAMRERAHEWGVPCAVERVVEDERRERTRLVLEDERLSVIAPEASHVPYQLRLIPHRHARSLSQATDPELASLAVILPRLERALLRMFPDASYNVAASFLGRRTAQDSAFHYTIDLVPRLTTPDAFEIASGVPVNPVRPETAAERYRAALADPL